jgi:hypothetical protein
MVKFRSVLFALAGTSDLMMVAREPQLAHLRLVL